MTVSSTSLTRPTRVFSPHDVHADLHRSESSTEYAAVCQPGSGRRPTARPHSPPARSIPGGCGCPADHDRDSHRGGRHEPPPPSAVVATPAATTGWHQDHPRQHADPTGAAVADVGYDGGEPPSPPKARLQRGMDTRREAGGVVRSAAARPAVRRYEHPRARGCWWSSSLVRGSDEHSPAPDDDTLRPRSHDRHHELPGRR